MQKDLRILQIMQKAREFADTDLQNEDLLASLLNADLPSLTQDEKGQICAILEKRLVFLPKFSHILWNLQCLNSAQSCLFFGFY